MGRPLSDADTYSRLSLWHETAGTSWTSRPSLPGSTDVDVAIVGAGYTGLWAAYYLAKADPTLRIAVMEAEVAGFGASGRNGGWCSALFPAALDSLASMPGSPGREAALDQHRAMRETVDEVARVADAEGIDAHLSKGGTIALARSRPQWKRARLEIAAARSWGRDETDVRLLDVGEANAVLRGSRTRGATYTPDCAVIHPARLVRGLAEAVERHGVKLYEKTPVTRITPGVVRTPAGDVRAETIIRATEGYTAGLAGHARAMVPVYSLMIATEQLSPAVWSEIGLARRETFTDHRHLVIYGQRTADDRLVFGGRGAPYHFGSQIKPGFDRDERVFARLYATLIDFLPVLAGTRVTHAWGGALGIPRDWCASVGLDRSTGLAWAGGYVGDGVSTTNLAGRTLRDLVLGHDTDLTRLPWVNHQSPFWEPEPLRWLGINAGLHAMTLADTEESVTRCRSFVARAVTPLLG